MRSKPTGSNFRKRNCCWVSWAASVKIAKKPRAEHPFAAFFIVNYAGSRCVSCGVLLSISLSLSLLSPLSLFLFLVLFMSLSLSLSFFLSLSLLFLSRSLFALSLSLLSSLFSLLSSLSLSSLYLSLLSPSLPLSLLSRSLHRLNCQPLLTGSKPPNPTTNLPTRLLVLSGREPEQNLAFTFSPAENHQTASSIGWRCSELSAFWFM